MGDTIKNNYLTKPITTCSKSTIETLEQGVKYVQVNNKDFIVNFEHLSHFYADFEQNIIC